MKQGSSGRVLKGGLCARKGGRVFKGSLWARKGAVKRRKAPYLEDHATIKNVKKLLGPVSGHSRTVVINAVNRCVGHPEQSNLVLKELASFSMSERGIAAAILSRIGRNRLKLEDFL